ncbi:general transcription factor IIH subunit 2 isoform X10 [Leptidea sinapis]|uniref:general transcription factor IIH subunit 2 isoform X1 n=1 Tax=Leptidea sinapis TaxID=189913 RepID=UPI00212BBC49|nr:general transcription factor IIH subunit 2 isoform X1 [Leptidea sinapis]XP_050666164.1 general transcription factor IIH subunit 2 isoform X2 [Leptidea sinapis]XP_050666165.1 general transcription factor IIH subunit 2 isoform X3 [Leptidea sinapis]XP_050666166.1 general transcription factor IIH subunit 2 isoform X4 [Leptidea sinapis]XP_050666167.1 general transcription factor IIH subunit 2 isoform X5 [Leptidea sinapis]XP_050666168.1 general transcription factor IIH subunit 2 isoform X6 [Lepti
MADDEQDPKEYRWETGYEKTWEAIKEDEDGLVEGLVAEFAQKAAKRAAVARRVPIRLGMMRHLLVAIDCSEAMSSQDLKPTRFMCTLKLLEKFIEEFFDQNPLSQLGLIGLKNKRAEKLTELSGNIRKHVKTVQGLTNLALTGEPSLQNTLELADKVLKPLPGHASRELLVLFASLTTCDPGDITTTIQTLKTDGIRCSVIGLAAEVRICKKLCQDTGGEYGVVLDDVHYRSLLLEHTSPPPRARALDAGLVKMGFPHTQPPSTEADATNTDPPITVCMCHVEEGEGVGGDGHLCPQCRSKYCSLPVQCRTCGLTLASAPHLARSYHHLFPVEPFEELKNEGQSQHCFACTRSFTDLDKQIHRCTRCVEYYCWECEGLISSTLHVCPGCASRPHLYQRLPNTS